MATQQSIAQGMIDQLRALDPAISAEVGTPERMIIDTVAQSIAYAQIDPKNETLEPKVLSCKGHY